MTPSRRFGTVHVDHTFTVPLDHERPDGHQIRVYAREIRATEQTDRDLPWLLFLGGGPGSAAPRLSGGEGWLNRALQDYRVLVLDQRGTGRSTPVDRRLLDQIRDPGAQARYLSHFRADAIVRDAELIRRTLAGDRPWSVLGQSFGGLCTTTYLSIAPHGLAEAFITGGLPGVCATAEQVYHALYPKVIDKSAEHYDRFPHDVDQARTVVRYLRDHRVTLPSGRLLTVEAFQSLGNVLGGTDGSCRLHHLLEDPFAGGTEPSDAFLSQADRELADIAGGPLYYLLHEATYAQGPGATDWSAHRVRDEFPAFDAAAALDSDAPITFTGEMIYPWMFDTDPMLQPFRQAAHLIAERPHWPALYDVDRLRRNTVPVVAAIYHDDMYLDRDLSLSTAQVIQGLKPWITAEYQHDGLRVSNGTVLERLLALMNADDHERV
ncbi:alpha/beta hydrolase [Streptomyces sp. SB3404]|uniref:Alpha/beta hydrolase n=2 Tax=Streptomyces boncukensis TaxID=2711219 RepID=A0A6G4WX63_9ACTN|nr:alpha/beta fold hydrolase [Streptomyces boncukensis]NGO69220.1 alpha/beta hydrolase [Streptomyces boncukensis]